MAVVEDTLYATGLFRMVGPPTGMLGFFNRVTGEAELTEGRLDSDPLNWIGVRAIEPDGQGGYFVGGDFQVTIQGQLHYNLVRLLPDGSIDPQFRPNPRRGQWGQVGDLLWDPNAPAPSGGGVLYVGGQFEEILDASGTHARSDLAALDAVTGQVLPLSLSFTRDPHNPGILAIELIGETLYVGGYFFEVEGTTRASLAAIDPTNQILLPWDAGLARSDPAEWPRVEYVAQGDATLYVAGNFQTVHGQTRNRLAEVSLTDTQGAGGLPTAWNPVYSGTSQSFRQLVVVEDYVWASGSFVQQGIHPLARVHRDTGVVNAYLVGPEVNDVQTGRGLAYDPDGPLGDGGPSGQGVLYLGANRRTTGSRVAPAVVAVDPATGQHAGFELLGGPEGPNRQPNVIHIESGTGGRLIVGGPSYFMGGRFAPGHAAFDLTTGRALEGYPPEASSSADVVHASPDGRFLYTYVRALGGAILNLEEIDLATGQVRDFLDPGPLPPPPPANWPEDLFVANSTSALLVAGDTLFVSISGPAAFNRVDASLHWHTSMANVRRPHEDQGSVLMIPAGEDSVFGSEKPTLILSAPSEYGPIATRRTGFFAVDPETGEVSDWYPAFANTFVQQGYGVEYQAARGDRPATLWLGGQFEGTVETQQRSHLMAVDPPSASLLDWNVPIGGSVAWETIIHNLAAIPDGMMLDGDHVGGVLYAGGTVHVLGTNPPQLRVAVFDAKTAEHLAWNPRIWGRAVRRMLYSERHGALFLGGNFTGALGGSGHSGLVAVSPYGWQPPVTTEPGGAEQPHVATLSAPFPNPARHAASVTLSLPQAGTVEVALYDVLGRRVAVVHDGPLPAGEHAVMVDTSHLAAGVYVVRAAGEGFSESKRITVVR